MRTDEEILKRLEEIKHRDFLGFESSDLIVLLPFDKAKSFLKDGYEEKDWKVFPRDKESVLSRMEEYMSFAWEKANNCRGLSASRTMDHYSAWLWIIGDEEEFKNIQDYEYYGKDELVRICEKYGWDHTQWDDGIRSNTEY